MPFLNMPRYNMQTMTRSFLVALLPCLLILASLPEALIYLTINLTNAKVCDSYIPFQLGTPIRAHGIPFHDSAHNPSIRRKVLFLRKPRILCV